MTKVLNILFIIIFLFIIALPTLSIFFQAYSTKSYFENRNLAQFPNLTETRLNLLPDELQHFYDDHMGFRQFLILSKNLFESKILNFQRINQSVIIGKNGFYFYNTIIPKLPNYDYSKVYFSPLELLNVKNELEEESIWFKTRSIPYLIVIAPDKEAIYPEYFPYPVLTNIRLDQLENYLEKNSSVRLIDLRKVLTNAKSKNIILYYKGDLHWNQYGAFYGYQEIMRQFSGINPEVYVPELSDFDVITTTNELITGDLVRIGMLTQDPESIQSKLIPKSNFLEKKKLKKLFIYGDSFAQTIVEGEKMGLAYFLPFSFEQVHHETYITEKERAENKLNPLELDQIEIEKPDLVIRETVQRNLRLLLGPKHDAM